MGKSFRYKKTIDCNHSEPIELRCFEMMGGPSTLKTFELIKAIIEEEPHRLIDIDEKKWLPILHKELALRRNLSSVRIRQHILKLLRYKYIAAGRTNTRVPSCYRIIYPPTNWIEEEMEK